MKNLLACLLALMIAGAGYSQNTYYWVGGAALSPQNISTVANWNTSLDGLGSPRTSSTSQDILVFDGSNYGGATPTTGTDSVNLNSSITCAQLKFVNGANIVFTRGTSGTSTLTISGDGSPAEDFVIESGCTVSLSNGPGSQVIVMGGVNNSGRVSGDFKMVTGFQARIANGTASTTTLVFTPGSTFTTNITAGSAAYAFGNSSQSTEKWVTFQPGSTLYYDGGYSPNGSSSSFQPINFLPGSNFVMRASNPLTGYGSFFSRKAFPNITVQNGATLTADGPVNRIDTLNITSGSTFVTYSSGQTVVSGNVIVNGTLNSPAGSTNEFVLAGNSLQTISGSGTISVASLVVADSANVLLSKSIDIAKSAVINGRIDFGTYQFTGAGTFTARAGVIPVSGTGNMVAGAYLITGVSGATGLNRGITVSGTGLAPGTRVASFTSNFDSIYISRPVVATASSVALTFRSNGATLTTSNTNGFDPATGSVALTDVQTFASGINYTINAATTKPFGISTGAAATFLTLGTVVFNAPATTNMGIHVSDELQVNAGKLTINAQDTVQLLAGAVLNGPFNAANYIVTGAQTASGNVGVLRRDGISGVTVFPIGTESSYMPATVTPVSPSDIAASVFQGITEEGTPNGTPLTPVMKQTKVDAVWTLNRVNGLGAADLQLQWAPALEGSTFATLPGSDIGVIVNQNPGWTLPLAPGDNTTNTASATVSSFGAFGIGAKPPAQPFVFNPLPAKTYGDPDFDAGVISANTTTPITYSSSNPAVATIVNNKIHIVGTGTTDITATQASDGFYPAANVTQPLAVGKATLTIKADDKTKPEGDPNPTFTVTYTGFVYGENQSVLTTPVSVTTTATTASPVGTYPIVPSGATAANYNINFVNGTLTVSARSAQTITFNAFPAKTYGNPDFAIGATSSNSTIPVTYTTSNPAVATIVGNNIHIVGAGTTTITASQAGSALFFPAQSVLRTLTVSPANLTVRVADTSRVQGTPNPDFTVTYSGFVLGENVNVLTTKPTATTEAGLTTPPGYYAIDVKGGVSSNYSFTYVNGRLTVLPTSGATEAHLQAYMSSSNTLTVKVYAAEQDLANIVIYDLSGKPVITKNVFLPKGFISAVISVSNLASGVYTVVVNGQTIKLRKNISIVR